MSDPHLSFVEAREEDGGKAYFPYLNFFHNHLKIIKPMHERTWSKGNDNYVGYLDKLRDYMELNAADDDLLIVTGDLSHDMTKKNVLTSLRWLDKQIRGIKVLIRGNHDWGVDFGELRCPSAGLTSTLMIEEGGITAIGRYAFGCYSNHGGTRKDTETGEQAAFTNRTEELLQFAWSLARFAGKHKKMPILLSHYPVPAEIAERIGKLGIKAYLSGHVHCTNNKVLPAQADWSWYNKTAAQTDDKTIEGCYFSTGTTDVLWNRLGSVVKRVDDQMCKLPEKGPKPERKFPKLKGSPAPIVLVASGLPGSGKSTWAKKLALRDGHVYVCQDEMGSRESCINAVAKALSEGQSVIVDRTNCDRRQREHWISLAKRYRVKQISCVYFDIPKEVCIERVLARKDHLTINDQIPDDRKRVIVERFASTLEKPELIEGFTSIAIFSQKDLDALNQT